MKKTILMAIIIASSIGVGYLLAQPPRASIEENKLTMLEDLFSEAQNKMQDLQTGNWSHTNSDGCDYTCRIARSGLMRYGRIGENLYKGSCDINQAFDLWNNSPSHQANLAKDAKAIVMIAERQEVNPNNCYIVYELID